MSDPVDGIETLDELRTFIHRTLCEKENLLAEQFAMSEIELTRRSRCCGLQFLLHGPRSVRLGAVWALDLNVVYLYDAAGRGIEKSNFGDGCDQNGTPRSE